MENNDKIQTGWRVPTKLKDDFANFCAKTSDSIEEECSAALYLYMRQPKKIRELAKLEVKGAPLVPASFWDDFAKGLELGIKVQLNIQQKGHRDPGKK